MMGQTTFQKMRIVDSICRKMMTSGSRLKVRPGLSSRGVFNCLNMKQIKIMSWNVKRLGSVDKCNGIQNLIRVFP